MFCFGMEKIGLRYAGNPITEQTGPVQGDKDIKTEFLNWSGACSTRTTTNMATSGDNKDYRM